MDREPSSSLGFGGDLPRGQHVQVALPPRLYGVRHVRLSERQPRPSRQPHRGRLHRRLHAGPAGGLTPRTGLVGVDSGVQQLGDSLGRQAKQTANVANGQPFRAELLNGLTRES